MVGCANYPREELVRTLVYNAAREFPGLEVVNGGRPGVARLALDVAAALHIPTREYGTDYGSAFQRNKAIVDAADWVFAFWDGICRPVAHMLKLAHNDHVPTCVFGPDGLAWVHDGSGWVPPDEAGTWNATLRLVS